MCLTNVCDDHFQKGWNKSAFLYCHYQCVISYWITITFKEVRDFSIMSALVLSHRDHELYFIRKNYTNKYFDFSMFMGNAFSIILSFNYSDFFFFFLRTGKIQFEYFTGKSHCWDISQSLELSWKSTKDNCFIDCLCYHKICVLKF